MRRQPVTRLVSRLHTQARKKLKLGHALSELEPSLAAQELVFNAPVLTPKLVDTIKRISPQFHLRPDDETSRRFWELNQNGSCWGEYQALEPFCRGLEPTKVLDIGPGLGRSTIFFKKHLGWQRVLFHLYEGTGSSTKYTQAGPRFDDSFCGNLEVLRSILAHNEIENFEIFDAQSMDSRLAELPGPYDLIYSFYAIGFHWSIGHFLEELLGLMTDHSIGFFTLHDRFEDFSELGETPHRVVEFLGSWPRGRWSRLLVLAKTESSLQQATLLKA
jgi:SAM-dependent methyltransferase